MSKKAFCALLIFFLPNIASAALRKQPVLIINTGTQCYINTALQCLMPTTFASWILNLRPQDEEIKDKLTAQIKTITVAYHTTTEPAIENTSLIKRLTTLKIYKDGEQGDASEFIRYIIQTFEDNRQKPPIAPYMLTTYKNAEFKDLLETDRSTLKPDSYVTTIYLEIQSGIQIVSEIKDKIRLGKYNYQLTSCIMRIQNPKDEHAVSGHYYALVRYGNTWYLVDTINQQTQTISTGDINNMLLSGYVSLNRGEQGVDQDCKASPIGLFYSRVSSPQDAIIDLSSSLHLIQALR